MKSFVFFLVFLVIAKPLIAQDIIYTGTFAERGSRGIYVLQFDRQTETLRLRQTVETIASPSFVCVHPGGRYLYSANRGPAASQEEWGSVSAYAIDRQTGQLTRLNDRTSHGAEPCYVSVDNRGKSLFAANYNSGSLAVFPIGKDGAVGQASQTIKLEGGGPHPTRQTQPHLHAAVVSPDNRRVYFPDLGADRIMIYQLADGALSPADQPWVPTAAGSGPRHFTFHPNGKFAYLAEELSSTVSAFAYDRGSGKLAHMQRLSTLPADFAGENTNADIHAHPNGKFLYVSNRGHNSIAIFSIEQETGRLEPAGHADAQGVRPRNFLIHPEGDYLFAANRDSDEIAIFRIEKASGQLTFTGNKLAVPSPVCLKFLKLGE